MDFKFKYDWQRDVCAEHIWLILTGRETYSDAERETGISQNTFRSWERVLIYRLGGEHHAKEVAEQVMAGKLDYPLDTLDHIAPKLIKDQISYIADNLPRICDVTFEQAIMDAAQALVERLEKVVRGNTRCVTRLNGEKVWKKKCSISLKEFRYAVNTLKEAKRISQWKSYRVAELGALEEKLAKKEAELAEKEAEVKKLKKLLVKGTKQNARMFEKLSHQLES